MGIMRNLRRALGLSPDERERGSHSGASDPHPVDEPPIRTPEPRRPRRYPGDYEGVPAMWWAPQPDGEPDPGEIVWTWVPFEEDHTRGKDRPVLLIGIDGDWLLGVPLTSVAHDTRTHDDPRYVGVGTGGWDADGRPSEANISRIIRVDADAIRREGSVLDREMFERVADAIRER